MFSRAVIEVFIKKAFRFVGCNQPDIAIFFKPETSETVNICVLSDNTCGHIYTKEHLTTLARELEKKFIFNGYRNISLHFIVFTNNINRDKSFSDMGYDFWMVDNSNRQLIIYENQPSDFCDIKIDFERSLSVIEKKKPKLTNFAFFTTALVAINIVIFILMEIFGSTTDNSFMAEYGANSWQLVFKNHEYYRLFTCMFLHFGSQHLFSNMLTLAVVGKQVENIMGHTKFIIVYLLSGIGASLMSALYNMNNNPDAYIISAGASGAIFGILGSLLILSLVYPQVRRTIQPLNLIIILMLSIFNSMSSLEIDNVAHIGGLMFGIIITFISCLCHKNVIKYNK